ncbi:AAA family ATPase [Ruminococcaceae bacterium OttesenSCG-928-A16]|nr:AAA family ATPase [Ruminococcaceae bacterium OttesenSCG-928-A16]
MERSYILSPARQLTDEEKKLVWEKPDTHIESVAERRICEEVKRNWLRGEMKITNILLEGDAGSGKTQLAKALSADFGLPYTKITCFADMDKSDILGAILPVLPEDKTSSIGVEYEYYPSEILRAYENGWLLEIQEPTVIRDAAVLMALNSALESDGSINLPTRIVHRHPDFIAVITTNRGYNGCRPLNEALRDRVQHSEKMDLPEIDVMVERAKAKTGCTNKSILYTFAQTIVELDRVAKANAIKGVAGMRSYFFWIDAVMQKTNIIDSLYHKVIYKITTDSDEIAILEQALRASGAVVDLEKLSEKTINTNGDVMEIRAEGESDINFPDAPSEGIPAVPLRKASDSEGHSNSKTETTTETYSSDNDDGGTPIYHEMSSDEKADLEQQQKDFRKQLNRQAREIVQKSLHGNIRLIVHRPESTLSHHNEYHRISSELIPVIREMVRRVKPMLEHEVSVEYAKSRFYGTKFNVGKMASPDFRHFSQKRPPQEEPTLAVALRIDESASMNAYGRIEAAKRAAVAVYEFCEGCQIPLLIYGDTADRSPLEQMSLYSYIDFEEPMLNDKYCLMNIRGHSNNRDGMALRILSEKLLRAPQETKLLISISDGQPKAMPDYSGDRAIADMKNVIEEYSRKNVLFLSAAIGQDKETICSIYGHERFIDITDLRQLPSRLVSIIAKHL